MTSARAETAAPRFAPIEFSELIAVSASDFTDPDGDDLESVELDGLAVDELCWGIRRRLDASVVGGLTAGAWKARALSLNRTRLERLELLSLAAPEAGWRNVAVRSSRIGSLELYDANLRRVRFVGCKLGFVNLRDADLADIAFTDCVIDGLDLIRATASRVSFAGCRLAHLEVTGARLSDVDLRGAQISDISGIEGLRGVTISIDQLFDLAPVLAGRLGIRVE